MFAIPRRQVTLQQIAKGATHGDRDGEPHNVQAEDSRRDHEQLEGKGRRQD
jgi:hypothetical protein